MASFTSCQAAGANSAVDWRIPGGDHSIRTFSPCREMRRVMGAKGANRPEFCASPRNFGQGLLAKPPRLLLPRA